MRSYECSNSYFASRKQVLSTLLDVESCSLHVHTTNALFFTMPRLQVSTRKRVIIIWRQGFSIQCIQNRFKEEDTIISLRSLQRLCTKFQRMHTMQDLHRISKRKILIPEMEVVMEESLRRDDEMTARKLKRMLGEKFVELPNVSLSTIKSYRKNIGWVCTRPHYCQLIREANKVKRKEWCQKQIDNKEDFENVIFTDECTVQLDHHGWLSFRKEKEPRALKQRPKHPAKIHIWGGISVRGPTRIITFTGNMNAIRYGKIVHRSRISTICQDLLTGRNPKFPGPGNPMKCA